MISSRSIVKLKYDEIKVTSIFNYQTSVALWGFRIRNILKIKLPSLHYVYTYNNKIFFLCFILHLHTQLFLE